MSESVIYRPENNRYMPVRDIQRFSPGNETPISQCEKFFPWISNRVRAIVYKGQSFPINTDRLSLEWSIEYVAFFAHNVYGTLELIALWATSKIDWLLETEIESV